MKTKKRSKSRRILVGVKRQLRSIKEGLLGTYKIGGKNFEYRGYVTTKGKAERMKDKFRSQGLTVHIASGRYRVHGTVGAMPCRPGFTQDTETQWHFYTHPPRKKLFRA